jgi:hypothetical protein
VSCRSLCVLDRPGAPWQLPPSGALAAALVAIEQGTPPVLSLINGGGLLLTCSPSSQCRLRSSR